MCWDCLPATFTKGRSFTTLVTSAFPNYKDQQFLVAELQAYRYFDVFSLNVMRKRWSCFACNHPEKVRNFLTQTNSPVIEVCIFYLKNSKSTTNFVSGSIEREERQMEIFQTLAYSLFHIVGRFVVVSRVSGQRAGGDRFTVHSVGEICQQQERSPGGYSESFRNLHGRRLLVCLEGNFYFITFYYFINWFLFFRLKIERTPKNGSNACKSLSLKRRRNVKLSSCDILCS